MNIEVLCDGAYGLSSLSEKTRKSNHLQMLLQRQHFLLSHLKTLSVGPARFELMISCTVVRCSTNWANRLAVIMQYQRYTVSHYKFLLQKPKKFQAIQQSQRKDAYCLSQHP